ncbi:MAG: phosphoserine phosphatase RsbU/P [Acidobacteriaceae bacterium]|nr:phosphoserine phosphatase RsbU/P [Acidobacteriaceae bacterium]
MAGLAHGQAQAAARAPLVVQEFGPHSVALDGAWEFHLGDDPGWASPALDDSGWAPIQVGRPWEGQGYRNATGFAWYRRHLFFAPATSSTGSGNGGNLALLLPAVQDAAEVYWNGRLVGSYGKVPPKAKWYIVPWPQMLVLGPAAMQGGTGVLAIRVWKAPYAYLSSPDTGGLVRTPLLGSAEAIAGLKAAAEYHWLKGRQYARGLTLLCTVISLMALVAWLRNRRQWMLFWLALYTLRPLLLLLLDHPGTTWRLSYGLIGIVFSLEDAALWFLLLSLLGLMENRRLVQWTRVFAVITIGLQLLEGSLQLFDWTRAPRFFLLADVGLTVPCLILKAYGVVLIAFAFRKRLDAVRWMVAIFALLANLYTGMGGITDLGERWTHWTIADKISATLFTIGGNPFDGLTVVNTLLLISIVYAVWRYTGEQNRRRSALEQEYRSAQELQQLLVPNTLPALPGYVVTSAYKPAQEVGGDFFQVIPLPQESALLIVGDVSGKGLKAAMTVSLIVGALRSLVETTEDPAEILAGLNRRLYGRLRGGFVTCLVLRLGAEGECVMASAGHLAPFLNGDEVTLPSALPLGLIAEAEFEKAAATVGIGDRLTLYTDGLLEARNAAGELFGFARVAELVAGKPDAQEAAESGIRFGQDDDITVLTATRLGARVEATTVLSAPVLLGGVAIPIS